MGCSMRNYRAARKLNNLKMIEAAKHLGISQPTLTSWENGTRNPSIEMLLRMADLYRVSVDFLLGHEAARENEKIAVSFSRLPLLSGKPVWIEQKGWGLVNSEKRCLVFSDGDTEPWNQECAFFTLQPSEVGARTADEEPLSYRDLKSGSMVWLEPISADAKLREELRGRYRIIGRYAENERGNRFALDTYGAKWLAFQIKQ